ncbi:MAG TPA: hypothetical protein VFZ65_14805 [Planctomycetota bacterium]|nr:hypothetical protein [Planctomycetota bacterium]
MLPPRLERRDLLLRDCRGRCPLRRRFDDLYRWQISRIGGQQSGIAE